MLGKRRPVFRESGLQRTFDRDGYVIVPLRDHAGAIAALWSLYHERPSGIESGFYSSTHSRDAAYKSRVSRGIKELCAALAQSYLADYRPLGGNFVVKFPGGQGELPVHQDWTMVDEARFSSVNCWIPMMEIDRRNGPLMVVKGSHTFLDTPRGSPSYPSPLDGLRDTIRDRYLTILTPAVGQMVIHDHRLIHYSPANHSDAPRVAAALGIVPIRQTGRKSGTSRRAPSPRPSLTTCTTAGRGGGG
jgi:Phytanoyl-CoA dioxygenase (PhyH)